VSKGASLGVTTGRDVIGYKNTWGHSFHTPLQYICQLLS